MLVYSVVVFAAIALIGLILASSVLRGQLAPWGLSLLHAALGAAGLFIAFLAILGGAGGLVPVSLIILVIAARVGNKAAPVCKLTGALQVKCA